MNKNKLKENNGITLIALIITIIVMLILVAVTITIAVNGGLFEYAGRAGKETNEAIEDEKLLAEGIINGQTINDIVNSLKDDKEYGKINGINVGDKVYWDSDSDGENETWIVLYNDYDYGCQLLCNDYAKTSYYYDLANDNETLQGATTADKLVYGYNHAVEILNNKCKELINNNDALYVRNIGCNPLNGVSDTLIDTTKFAYESYPEDKF